MRYIYQNKIYLHIRCEVADPTKRTTPVKSRDPRPRHARQRHRRPRPGNIGQFHISRKSNHKIYIIKPDFKFGSWVYINIIVPSSFCRNRQDLLRDPPLSVALDALHSKVSRLHGSIPTADVSYTASINRAPEDKDIYLLAMCRKASCSTCSTFRHRSPLPPFLLPRFPVLLSPI